MGTAGCSGDGVTGAPAPGRRNADVEGASLMGVPTVGVAGSECLGPSSSTAMRDADGLKPITAFDGGEELVEPMANSGERMVLCMSDGPTMASACAGS